MKKKIIREIKSYLFIFFLFSPFIVPGILVQLGVGIEEPVQEPQIAYAAEEEVTEGYPPQSIIDYDPADASIAGISRGLGHEVTEETKNRVRYLYRKAEEAGINPENLVRTIYCECMWYSIQSGATYPDGTQEQSFGLAQIHLPSHPNITREQALNAYFAIDWMIEHWDHDIWYGYDRTTKQCTNGIKAYW